MPPVKGNALTPRQLMVLAFIDDFLRTKKRFPRHSELRERMGWRTDDMMHVSLAGLVLRGELDMEKSPTGRGRLTYRRRLKETA